MSVTGQDLSRVDADFEMVKINLGEIIMVRIIFKGNNVRIYLLYPLQLSSSNLPIINTGEIISPFSRVSNVSGIIFTLFLAE